MSDEPDNLVLKLLREIRAKQDEQAETLKEHGEILEELRDDLQRTQTAVMSAVGYAATANNEVGALLTQVRKIDDRLSRLEETRR
jgi:predicted  nucleic acid-binding Zn-ribbon protein